MTDKRKPRVIKSEEKPVLDSTVYPRLTKKPKSSDDLPYRKLYNLEILNATGTSYQGLEDLQELGPFQARGSVPLTETTRSIGDRKERGRLINIKAESIVEWTHEFNKSKVMEPVFWILSEDVCWYQIQNMHPNYDPWIRPLADVCVYLDALIHSHFTLKVNDELKDLVPQVSKLLNMSTEAVMDALKEHEEQILRLCQSDKELKTLKFVQAWLKDARPPSTRRSRSVQPSSALIHPADTPAAFSSTSTPATTPTPTSVPQEDEIMARTKAAIKLAQRQEKMRLMSPPQHVSELESVTATLEDDKNEHKEKVGKYLGMPAPCPGNCPLHEKTLVFNSELEMLVKDKYDRQDGKDGKKNYSVPYDFQCPIDTCLINISNSLSPTPSDFAELILQHLCEHDLTANNMEHIKRYLATSQPPMVKLELEAKNQQQQAHMKCSARPMGIPTVFSQTTDKALNVHLYWELQAGSFQFKAGNSNIFSSGATKLTAVRNIPTQTRSGRRQANYSRTRSVLQRPDLSDLEPRTHTQNISSSDASPSSTSHEAQTSTTIVSGIDEPTTVPVPFAAAVAAHQSAISSLSQKRPPMCAIEITDDDGDDNGDVESMRIIENETMATGFIRRPYNDRSETTRQHAQLQNSARISTFTSKFHQAAKRDRSDSYDDDFMQPKHRMPYGNRFEVANSSSPKAPPVARELIEIHGTDSEASGEDDNMDDKYALSRLERKRQRTMKHGTDMASYSGHQRTSSSNTVATSHTSTNSSSNVNSNNKWFDWAKPARIAMSYISNPQIGQSEKKDA